MRRQGLFVCAILLAIPMSAQACEEIWALAYSGGSADLRITINDAPVLRDGSDDSMTGSVPVGHWLVDGENVLKATTAARGAEPARLSVEVVKSCRGETIDTSGGNAGVQAKLELTETGEATATFDVAKAPPNVYAAAAVSDAEGLDAAVRKLQAAFKSGDIDTIIAMHRPFIEMAELMGMRGASDMLRGMLEQTLSNADLTLEDQIVIEPALGGRAHVASGADRVAPPIVMEAKTDGGSLIFSTGIFWAKFDGTWLVIAG